MIPKRAAVFDGFAAFFEEHVVQHDPYSSLKAVIAIAVTTFEMFRQLESIHNSFRLAAKANPNVVLTHLLKRRCPTDKCQQSCRQTQHVMPRTGQFCHVEKRCLSCLNSKFYKLSRVLQTLHCVDS